MEEVVAGIEAEVVKIPGILTPLLFIYFYVPQFIHLVCGILCREYNKIFCRKLEGHWQKDRQLFGQRSCNRFPIPTSPKVYSLGDRYVKRHERYLRSKGSWSSVQGRCLRSQSQSAGFLSALFVVPKNHENFARSFCHPLTTSKEWMVKLDLKDAYLTIPNLPAHQKFIRFTWRKKIYKFSCLLFGLSSAPRLFTKILKGVVAFFWERGLRLLFYLDDILILNEDKSKLESDIRFVSINFWDIGFYH